MNDQVLQLEKVGIALYSRDVEEAVLTNLLIAPNDIWEHPLDDQDFYIHKHRFVFQAFILPVP